MNSSNKLLFYIFVIVICGSEKCVCTVLINDAYLQLEKSNPIYNINTENLEYDAPLILVEKFKRLKFYDDVKSRTEETKAEVVHRVTRQAHYDGTSLYPQLPTAPYQQQPYQNPNFNFNTQTNYTNPAYQQWHSSQPYNNSGSGYPSNNPAYNNNYQTHPYNPFDQRPHNNQQGSNNNYNPNFNYQQHNNSSFGPGYPYRNSVSPGAPNANSYNPPRYSQSNNYSGYPPHSSYGRNNVSYNSHPTPTYYLTGNSSLNKYPNSFYTSTLSPSFNRTGYVPAQGNFPSNWTLKGRPTNSSNSYYPVSSGYNRYQNNGSVLYEVNHYVTPAYNLNRTHQSRPYYPSSNNINNIYSQNYPARNPGYTSYNNSNNFNPNQAVYPKSNQYGTNYYPNNQFNRTSPYRLAETYTPSIPSHPPRNGSFTQNQLYYTSNMNGNNQDPTKVAPERFSYH